MVLLLSKTVMGFITDAPARELKPCSKMEGTTYNWAREPEQVIMCVGLIMDIVTLKIMVYFGKVCACVYVCSVNE